MVDCSVCAGVGDDAGDQRYHRELAANRSGASKPVDQVLPNVRLSDDVIDLMKAFSLSSAEGIGGAWGTTAPADPLRRTFRPLGNSLMAAVVEA